MFKKTLMMSEIGGSLSKSEMVFKGLKILFVGFYDIFIFEESGC